MSKVFTVAMVALTAFCIWATYTGYGLPVSELDPMDLRQESVDQRAQAHHRRFAGGGYRRGK